MIFDLVQDFAAALSELPSGHPQLRVLKLLEGTVQLAGLEAFGNRIFEQLWDTIR